MLMVCHHLDAGIAEDLAFAESRIRRETIAAEDVLHDLGAISMFSSDSQAMGRVGEVILRCWQTAHKMKQQRGALPGRHRPPRQRRASSATSPSTRSTPRIAHGIAHEVGSIEVGKWADLVVWKPAFFGVKPALDAQGRLHRRWPRWATPTRPSPRRSPCTTGRCSAPTAAPSPARLAHLRVAGGAGRRRRRAPAACTRRVAAVRRLPHRAQEGRHGAQRLHCRRWRSTRRPTPCAPTASCSPASRPTVLPMAQRYFLF